jgi:regulator of sirC expression with transglutaminase-like and TPR domain
VALVIISLVSASSAWAQRIADAPDPNLPTIRAILEKPDKQIDLARTKLTIDRMIDPGIDIEANLKKLDAMAKQIRTYLPPNSSQIQKMEILRDYVYKPGPWNDNQPYRYDLDDPFGKNIRNKLLPTYLLTKRGNCVSMPFLFIILGEKIGLDLTASTVPLHVFVKYRGDDGQFYNFEATSGGPILDASLKRYHPMTEQALVNGLYLRPLTKKETVALMANTMMEFYGQEGLHEQRIALADLLLEYHPSQESAMLQKGHAYYGIVKRDYLSRFLSPTQIPAEQKQLFYELTRNNRLWYAKAEALGWREPDKLTEANYLRTVNQAKSLQQNGETK